MICTDHYSQCYFVLTFPYFTQVERSKETKRISQKTKREDKSGVHAKLITKFNSAWYRLSLESPVVRKTFSAVNWSVRIRFERHFGFNTTIRTDRLVHFSGSAEITPSEISVIKSQFCFTLILVFLIVKNKII